MPIKKIMIWNRYKIVNKCVQVFDKKINLGIKTNIQVFEYPRLYSKISFPFYKPKKVAELNKNNK